MHMIYLEFTDVTYNDERKTSLVILLEESLSTTHK